MFSGLPWNVIFGLAATGIFMALLSSLVGIRQKLEVPLWWGLYALWIAFVLIVEPTAPFRTILVASFLAGIVHAATQSLLLDAYIANNPWYADQMQKPKTKLAVSFLTQGVLVGIVFGALVGGIAWAIQRWML